MLVTSFAPVMIRIGRVRCGPLMTVVVPWAILRISPKPARAQQRVRRVVTGPVRYPSLVLWLTGRARSTRGQGGVIVDVGIGLPTTIPDTEGMALVEWARRAEEAGFSTLGTIGRLVYPNYDDLIALAAAAAVTERIRLTTSILIAPLHANTALLANRPPRLTGCPVAGWC